MAMHLHVMLALGAVVSAFCVAPASHAETHARLGGTAWQRDLFKEAPATAEHRWHLGRAQLDALLQQDDSDFGLPPSSELAPRRWWPVLASVALPGLGETLTGYRRGWFMMAADVGTWAWIAEREAEGDRWEDRYEEFALRHWDEEQWARALSEGRLNPFYPDLGAGTVREDVALYVSRELDEREWFENLGKWDVFAWGWREFWDEEWNGTNHPQFLGPELYNPSPSDPSTWFFPGDRPTMTPLRDEYLDMRVKSNDAYDTRDKLFNVAVLLRVFSALQVAYLEGFIGTRYDAPSRSAPASDGVRADWIVAPMQGDGALVGWKVVY